MPNSAFRPITPRIGNISYTPSYLNVRCVLAITLQPEAVSIDSGEDAEFTVEAQNFADTGLAYQWQESTDGVTWADLANGGVYSGVTTGTLTITAAPFSLDGNSYRAVVSSSVCEINSQAAGLEVSELIVAQALLVGGGGGGGAGYGAGGGAGEVEVVPSLSLEPDVTYPVVVGAAGTGGAGSTPWNSGTDGTSSTFFGLTALGGGGGGGISKVGRDGGSGGGGGAGGGGGGFPPGTYAAGIGSPGFSGGTGYGDAGTSAAGGGGGAGGAGGNGAVAGAPRGGNGGAGLSSSISGSALFYGGGGGGGAFCAVGAGLAGTGGSGVGGAGALGSTCGSATGSNATANRGSGGGGGGNPSGGGTGGNGSAGVVIVRYPGSARFTGGTITTDAGDTIHTFTTSADLVPA
jgi:hypothetical protein